MIEERLLMIACPGQVGCDVWVWMDHTNMKRARFYLGKFRIGEVISCSGNRAPSRGLLDQF